MTDDLITEEVEGNAVLVASSELATQLRDVESYGLVKVVGRYSQVEDVSSFSHGGFNNTRCRRPRRREVSRYEDLGESFQDR